MKPWGRGCCILFVKCLVVDTAGDIIFDLASSEDGDSGANDGGSGLQGSEGFGRRNLRTESS